MIDKTINDVSLKKLTFQTGQTKWDGGSTYLLIIKNINKVCCWVRRVSGLYVIGDGVTACMRWKFAKKW